MKKAGIDAQKFGARYRFNNCPGPKTILFLAW
jgi:hypothetical protein